MRRNIHKRIIASGIALVTFILGTSSGWTKTEERQSTQTPLYASVQYSQPLTFPPETLPENRAETLLNQSHEMIVAGFTLQGKKPWEKMAILDMNVVVTPSKKRYLQLFCLLKALNLEKTVQSGGRIEFQPEGFPIVIINPNAKEMEIEGVVRPVDLLVAISDISKESDIFLSPETIAELFSLDLKWNEQNFEFGAQTTRKLKIWKTSSTSAHGMQIQDTPTNLPEMHTMAYPDKASLDFVELRVRAGLDSGENIKSLKGGPDILQQSLWGSLFDGRYKLQFNEKSQIFGDKSSAYNNNSTIMLTRGEWNRRFSTTEVNVGDSSFGLNNLTFPGVTISGLRVNGITGLTDENSSRDRSALGLYNYFVQPKIFSGNAPRGSQVELIINGQIRETQEAISERYSPVGMGKYSFEEIILAPGSLNDVHIVITDPSGFKTHIQENILGSSLFLPKGNVAYLGGLGTGRDVSNWHTRGIFSGGRLLYAIEDNLTVATTLGFQQNLYNQPSTYFLLPEQRRAPDASFHAGGQLIWKPNNHLILNGDFSYSMGKDETLGASYKDSAWILGSDIFPTNKSTINTQLFRYGTDFFNGQNPLLRDRQGYGLNGKWDFHKDWQVSSGMSHIQNNLDGDLPETLSVNFQNLMISSKVIPYSMVSAAVDRVSPDWDDPKVIYILKVQAHPFSNVSFDSMIARGDSLYLNDHSEFLSGITMPGIATFEEPSTSAALRVTTERSEVGLTYSGNASREKGAITHSFQGTDIPFRVRSEIGYEFVSQTPVIENRSEYRFDGYGNKRLELLTRLEQKQWSVGLSLNIIELFAFNKSTPYTVQDRRIRPENGGVKGRVYMDYNANAEMDQDEEGLENVTVRMGNSSCQTDKDGYFILPGPGQSGASKVFIDLKSVPAIYSPTHGIQSAFVSKGALTEVNLCVTPVISLSGFVKLDNAEKAGKPVPGVRVFLTRLTDSKKIAESYTAGDGSYYVGDVRPGKYLLQVDRESLPNNVVIKEENREVIILPNKEPQELNMQPFLANQLIPGHKT